MSKTERFIGIYPTENGYATIIANEIHGDLKLEAAFTLNKKELKDLVRSTKPKQIVGVAPSFTPYAVSELIELPPVDPEDTKAVKDLIEFEVSQNIDPKVLPDMVNDVEVFSSPTNMQGMLLVSSEKIIIKNNFGRGVKVVTPSVALPLLYHERGKAWPGSHDHLEGDLEGIIAVNEKRTDFVIAKNGIPVWYKRTYFGSSDFESASRDRYLRQMAEEVSEGLLEFRKISPLPKMFYCPNQGDLAEKIDEAMNHTDTPIEIGYRYPYTKILGSDLGELYFYAAAAILARDVPIDLNPPGKIAGALSRMGNAIFNIAG
jgi:hypothetical protein